MAPGVFGYRSGVGFSSLFGSGRVISEGLLGTGNAFPPKNRVFAKDGVRLRIRLLPLSSAAEGG